LLVGEQGLAVQDRLQFLSGSEVMALPVFFVSTVETFVHTVVSLILAG
jgi:hypothetical protein